MGSEEQQHISNSLVMKVILVYPDGRKHSVRYGNGTLDRGSELTLYGGVERT